MRIGSAWVGIGGLILAGCVSESVVGASAEGAPSKRSAIVAAAGQQLGERATSLGDLDGDGIDDFAIFARRSQSESPATPADWTYEIYLYYGRHGFPEQLSTADADASFHGPITNLRRGGDLNGDGRADLLLNGAEWGQFVFGSSQRLQGPIDVATIGVRWRGPRSADSTALGGGTLDVEPAGDVNGDGLDDVLVGVADLILPSPFDIDPWRRFLVLGRKAGWLTGVFESQWAVASFAGQRIDRSTPTIVAPTAMAAGDIDGDGYADLTVISSYTTQRLHYGGPDKLRGTLGDAEADATLVHTGSPYEPAGDLDGDGRDDLVTWLQLPDQDSPSQDPSLIYGRSERWSGVVTPSIDLTVSVKKAAENSDLYAGTPAPGDIDQDGQPDLVVAVPLASQVYVIRGTGQRLLGSYQLRPQDLFMQGVQFDKKLEWTTRKDSDALGTTLDVAGDLDGNGGADILVGAPGSQSLESDFSGGTVFLIGGYQRPL